MVNIINQDNVSKHVSQVDSILPQFVVEDHPKFVSFLKDYYRWSSSIGPLAALNYLKYNNDIDFVMDTMIDGFSNLFAYNIPKEMKGDYRFFLKFLKHFYEIKGTEESYRILYNALYGEEVSVFYPKRSLFVTSDAKWSSDKTFIIKYEGDGFALAGLTLKGGINGYRCLVSDVIKSESGWVVYPQNESGEFEPNEILEIVDTDEYAQVAPVYEIVSIDSKSKWHDNAVINLGSGLVMKVDKINYGSIAGMTITNGGTGYSLGDLIVSTSEYSGTGFKAEVGSIGQDGEVLSVNIMRTGFGYVNENVEFVIDGNGTGFKALPIFNDEFRQIHTASLISNRINLSEDEITMHFGDNESVTFKQGTYTKPRYWKLIRGALSTETARLHDSSFYQDFSYSLVSSANTINDEVAIKKALQIAGLKMFVERTISIDETIEGGESMSIEVV